MVRLPTKEISKSILKSMFRKFDIWRKIKCDQLTSIITGSYPSRQWPDATSEIIKHYTLIGKHIATTHRVRDSSGKILHWDAKDIRLNQVCYYRK